MNKLSPLLIGMPLTYKLIDFELLLQNNIAPILAYPKGTETLEKGSSVFYHSLTLDEIDKLVEQHQVDAIVCFNDNFLVEAAKLKAKYKMPGILYPEIQKYKVKSEMYKALSPYLTVPKTLNYKDSLSFEAVVESLGLGEYFIKPDCLAGAEGGSHIKNKADFSLWKESSRKPSQKYIIQNFYSLPLYHCELIVKDGKVLYIQARRYSHPNHHFLAGKIIASFPIIDEAVRFIIEQEAIKVQQFLEFKNGVMHTEFFLENNQNPVFLETNIRQAGGAINLIHKRRAGVSLETVMVLIELEKDVSTNPINDALFDFCGYIPIKEGQVSSIVIPKLKGHYDFDFRVKIGEFCHAPKSASNVAASFIGYSSDYNDLTDDFFCLEHSDIIKYC